MWGKNHIFAKKKYQEKSDLSKVTVLVLKLYKELSFVVECVCVWGVLIV